MADAIPEGPGTATLVVPMPGTVRPPTDAAAATLSWLSAHGAPRTAGLLRRLERQGWTIEPADPDTPTQSELWATAGFAGVAEALAAARPHAGSVSELMRWSPGDRPADATWLPVGEEPSR